MKRKEKFDIHFAPAKAGLHTAKIGQGSQKMQIPLANSEDPNYSFHLFSWAKEHRVSGKLRQQLDIERPTRLPQLHHQSLTAQPHEVTALCAALHSLVTSQKNRRNVSTILIHDEWNSETRASINQIPKIDEEGDIFYVFSTLSARDSPELFVFCAWWPNLELFNCDSESRLLISLDLKTVTWF